MLSQLFGMLASIIKSLNNHAIEEHSSFLCSMTQGHIAKPDVLKYRSKLKDGALPFGITHPTVI